MQIPSFHTPYIKALPSFHLFFKILPSLSIRILSFKPKAIYISPSLRTLPTLYPYRSIPQTEGICNPLVIVSHIYCFPVLLFNSFFFFVCGNELPFKTYIKKFMPLPL